MAAIGLFALLAGCARAGGASAMPGAPFGSSVDALPDGSGYKQIYAFQNGTDGANPYAGLTALGGTLYGTTLNGGSPSGWGTIYKIEPSGSETVMYQFAAGKDGAHPYGGLTAVGTTLYGTTYQGGTKGSGTVFSITTSGTEKVVYSFQGGSDGQYPYCRLVDYKGALYGTTYQGGTYPGWGVVFKVDPATGKESVLYKFKAGKDGAHPFAGLLVANGQLYGTTYQGGTKGAGTVFSITTAGTEKVLYSFQGGYDGQYPFSRLVLSKGVLYGTTYQGGVYPGWGVVFGVTPGGRETVLYRFLANNDGAHPQYAGLVAYNGGLYGTTYQGGKYGAGTVFKVDASGAESVLYSFKGNSDGLYPYAGLVLAGSVLYGTTTQGGTGVGTVFKISP